MKRFLLTLALLLVVGCDDSKPAAPASTLPPPTFGNATVTGHVRFVGTPPERKMIDTSNCEGASAYQEETIIVGEGGGLKDAVVYLKDAPASDGSSASEVVLDQIKCRYVPHVVAVQVNQPLKITTSDSTFHNVRLVDHAKEIDNYGLPQPGQSKTHRFDKPCQIVASCSVHPWMNASVAIVSSPFFAVSTRDGQFKIDRIPPGKYTIAVWHPILGERTSSIEVAAGGELKADLEFAPPKPR